mmetsp:Transcript_6236/g.12294  ORF Transcript_6236/g.12294 Transcript_6236/m.12294 type:complete len:232 (-) Transcript_6236:464-1159(-)
MKVTSSASAATSGTRPPQTSRCITLDGLRSPWPLTTGICSSSNRRRMRATSALTCSGVMPSGSAASPFLICSSISSMKCQRTGGSCDGRGTECSAASLGARALSTPLCAFLSWMSVSVSVRPRTKSVIIPSSFLYMTRGPRPWAAASASAAPRIAGVSRSFASGLKILATTYATRRPGPIGCAGAASLLSLCVSSSSDNVLSVVAFASSEMMALISLESAGSETTSKLSPV